MIVWESSLIRILCDDWGRWSLYYKHRNHTKELRDIQQVCRIIRLEEKLIGVMGYSYVGNIDEM